MEVILTCIGIAIITASAFYASALGVTICGKTVIGAMKKNPDAFGSYLVLSALPSSQGLYGFVMFFMLQPFIRPDVTMFQAWVIFFISIMVAIVGIYASYRQAIVCANGISATAEGHNVTAATLIMAVFPELYAILALLVTILVSMAIA
jgi:V/A-type H+-transporting ATPase subunit K